jgi:hypothetical protein
VCDSGGKKGYEIYTDKNRRATRTAIITPNKDLLREKAYRDDEYDKRIVIRTRDSDTARENSINKTVKRIIGRRRKKNGTKKQHE